MFPISIFERQRPYKEKPSFSFPTGTDLNQVELRREPHFETIIERLKNHSSKAFLKEFERVFCFFCGEETEKVVPAFLHNFSGVNLWMFQDWRCSFAICTACNSHSGGERVNYRRGFKEITPNNPYKLISFEPDILIPSLEPVHRHFHFLEDGSLEAETIRGYETINRFGLNRSELMHRRREFVEGYKLYISMDKEHSSKNLNTPIDLLFNKLGLDQSAKLISEQSRLYVTPDSSIYKTVRYKNIGFVSVHQADRAAMAYDLKKQPSIKEIKLSGVRGFKDDQSLKLNGKNSIILLGENGVGKSTLLEVILNLIRTRPHFKFHELADNPREEPKIIVEYADQQLFSISASGQKGVRYTFPVVHIKENRLSKGKVDKLSSFVTGIRSNEMAFKAVARKLKILLDMPQKYELHVEGGHVFWQVQGDLATRIYLTNFSSGYTSLLNIFYEINRDTAFHHDTDRQVSMPEVVLIDEIELHLHPKFKKGIVKKLQVTFPGVLFVITTHDPLVLNSAENNVLVVALNKVNRKTLIDQSLPDHRELTTEQLLTSPIFGLDTISHDPKLNDVFERYYEALKLGDKESLGRLRKELALTGHFGRSFREYIALSAIDSYLVKNEVPVIENIEVTLKKLDKQNEKN